MILRDRDITNGWSGAGDGVLEERAYLLQNWRAGVIAIIAPNGGPMMYYRYDAYGVPTSIHPCDINADGMVDFTDFQLLDDMVDSFDQRGDFVDDFGFSGPDGIVEAGDFVSMLDFIGTYGRGFVADADAEYGGLRKLYAGYEFDPSLAGFKYHVRNRVYDAEQGRWTRRDPLGYVDGMGLYAYINCHPMYGTDPTGLASQSGGGCPGVIWYNEKSRRCHCRAPGSPENGDFVACPTHFGFCMPHERIEVARNPRLCRCRTGGFFTNCNTKPDEDDDDRPARRKVPRHRFPSPGPGEIIEIGFCALKLALCLEEAQNDYEGYLRTCEYLKDWDAIKQCWDDAEDAYFYDWSACSLEYLACALEQLIPF